LGDKTYDVDYKNLIINIYNPLLMKTKTFTLSVVVSILLSTFIFLQYGCKKKSDDSSQNQQNIPVTTKVIDTTNWRNNFISVDTTNYTFTFKNAVLNQVSLKQGDILVSGVGDGYLRKVTDVQQSGNTVIITTSFASLTDAVQNGSFTIKSILSAQKIKKIRYKRNGVSIDLSHIKSNENTNLDYNLDTYLDDSHLIHLTGEFSILPSINSELEISWFTIKSFKIEYEVQEQLNLEGSIDLLNLQYDKEIELADVTFNPIVVFIGGVPVVLVPDLEIDAGTDINIQSAITTSANQQLTYTVGLNYMNNQWTPSQTYSKSFTYQPPTLSASAGAKIYIKPKLKIMIYGVASPYLFGEGYVRIQADLLATPWWSLYAGASVGAGVQMEILGHDVLDYYTDPPFFDYETLIAAASGQPPTVTTAAISNITQTTATDGGNVTSQGSSSVTSRGVCWSTSQNPTITNSHTTDGSGTGSFTSNLTGLTTNTHYYVRAYATNITGTAYGNQVSFTTTGSSGGQPCPGMPTIIINHVAGSVAPVNKTVTYGTVTNIPGETSKCWITSNLGADHQATAKDDATEASAGWYWQFNRKQGYKNDGTTVTPSWTITWINENLDWQTANDPCALELGSGWRIPTYTEWNNVNTSGGWTDWNGPWNSGLKLHAAGHLTIGGTLDSRGYYGSYWSSAQFDANYSWSLFLGYGNTAVDQWGKAGGQTLRCLRD